MLKTANRLCEKGFDTAKKVSTIDMRVAHENDLNDEIGSILNLQDAINCAVMSCRWNTDDKYMGIREFSTKERSVEALGVLKKMLDMGAEAKRRNDARRQQTRPRSHDYDRYLNAQTDTI